MVIASFFTRLYNRLVEAQMRRAQRELALHRHLMPRDLESTGNKLTGRNEDALPFGR